VVFRTTKVVGDFNEAVVTAACRVRWVSGRIERRAVVTVVTTVFLVMRFVRL
jgi:hypothetical protein